MTIEFLPERPGFTTTSSSNKDLRKAYDAMYADYCEILFASMKRIGEHYTIWDAHASARNECAFGMVGRLEGLYEFRAMRGLRL